MNLLRGQRARQVPTASTASMRAQQAAMMVRMFLRRKASSR